MTLDSILDELQKSVPDCVAAGVVDLESSKLLSVTTANSHPSEVLDLVAAATGELFKSEKVRQVERALRQAPSVGEGARDCFNEVLVTSEDFLHLFRRCAQRRDIVLVTVCRRKANIGVTLNRTRMLAPRIEAVL